MTKLQKEIKLYKEVMKNDKHENIYSLLGWLNASKTINEQELKYITELINKWYND